MHLIIGMQDILVFQKLVWSTRQHPKQQAYIKDLFYFSAFSSILSTFFSMCSSSFSHSMVSPSLSPFLYLCRLPATRDPLVVAAPLSVADTIRPVVLALVVRPFWAHFNHSGCISATSMHFSRLDRSRLLSGGCPCFAVIIVVPTAL